MNTITNIYWQTAGMGVNGVIGIVTVLFEYEKTPLNKVLYLKSTSTINDDAIKIAKLGASTNIDISVIGTKCNVTF